MKNKYLILLLLSCIYSINDVHAQTTKYKFSVRFEDFNPLKNDVILINNQLLNTDNYGNVEAVISNVDLIASVRSPSIEKYRIRYPVNMQAILPKNASVVIDIFVERPNKQASASSAANKEDIRQVQRTIEKYQQSKDAALMRVLQDKISGIYDSLSVLINRGQTDVAQLKQGRLRFLPQITQALNHYLNEARDLKDALTALSFSLNKQEAYEQFATAIYSYNEIFELINANKSTYEQAIEYYWQSREFALKLSNLLEYALEEVHKPFILEMNDRFIAKAYAYTRESNGSKKKKMGSELVDEINAHVESLEKRLNSMSERIAAFNTRLGSFEIVE